MQPNALHTSHELQHWPGLRVVTFLQGHNLLQGHDLLQIISCRVIIFSSWCQVSAGNCIPCQLFVHSQCCAQLAGEDSLLAALKGCVVDGHMMPNLLGLTAGQCMERLRGGVPTSQAVGRDVVRERHITEQAFVGEEVCVRFSCVLAIISHHRISEDILLREVGLESIEIQWW